MLVKLALNSKKVEQYNQRIRELKAEYPDFSFDEVEELEDVFCPYDQLLENAEWLKNYKPVAVDHRPSAELNSIYACGLSSDEYTLKAITDYKRVLNVDSPIYWHGYGVADNASQILDYYERLLAEYGGYMNSRKFIITMSPIFRENQPENGGWRWHKWGQYIGDFAQQHEYLYDEKGIDYVWVFTILEVEEDK